MERLTRNTFSVLFLSSLLLAVPLQAQVAVGLSGGVNISTLTGDGADELDLDSRTGILVGGFASFPLTDIVSLTSGLYYAQKGASGDEGGVDVSIKLDYLEVPLLLQVGLSQRESVGLSVFLGPSLAFEMKCDLDGSDGEVSASVSCEDAGLETKGLSFNAIFGAGARFMTSSNMFFLANGGLNMGLTSIDDSDSDTDGDTKNSSWFAQVGLGWIVGG